MSAVAEFLKSLAEVIKALAWPTVVVAVLYYAKGHFATLLRAVSDRIISSQKVIFRGGRVAIELAGEVARGTVATKPNKQSEDGVDQKQEFQRLAEEYRDLKIEDYNERVAARHDLADRLGALAIDLKIPRRDLASDNEGYLVAFATAVIREPVHGDLGILEIAAPHVRFKFTGYRMVLALLRILSGDGVRRNTLRRATDILAQIQIGTKASEDAALSRLIGRAGTAIDDLDSELS